MPRICPLSEVGQQGRLICPGAKCRPPEAKIARLSGGLECRGGPASGRVARGSAFRAGVSSSLTPSVYYRKKVQVLRYPVKGLVMILARWTRLRSTLAFHASASRASPPIAVTGATLGTAVAWKLMPPALMAKHGDLEIARLAGKLRCTTCGHRPEEVRPDWQLPERTARRLLL